MTIAIIGAGSVGQALARGWLRVGHEVLLGVRDESRDRYRAVADEVGARILSPVEAAEAGDVVVLALPWAVASEAVAGLGPLSGKVVIDCMNPLGQTGHGLGLTCGFTTSGGEQVAGWLPGARVVKTLNQVGAEVMADASGFPVAPAMFLAGDDAAAKATAARLVEDIGFRALDAGALVQARLLEPLAMVWINQAIVRKKGRDWAFGAMTRSAAGDG